MTSIPKIIKVGETYRFIFSATTVRATVNEIDNDTDWLLVSVQGVGDYWMNPGTVAGIQTEDEAKKAEAERAQSTKENKG